jgi:hypothetical protein
MLGRKTYTADEINRPRVAIEQQLTTYDKLAASADPGARSAFDTLFFNNLLLVLDRPFVHRIRPVTGKDCNPLNEVELLVESILTNQGQLLSSKVIKWIPENTVTGLDPGDNIQLTEDGFKDLAAAFFATLESKFLEA